MSGAAPFHTNADAPPQAAPTGSSLPIDTTSGTGSARIDTTSGEDSALVDTPSGPEGGTTTAAAPPPARCTPARLLILASTATALSALLLSSPPNDALSSARAVALALPPTALPFLVGFYLLGGRGGSSLCAALIAAQSFTRRVVPSMATFLAYLLLDTFLRDDAIPLEIAAHHAISAVITTAGLLVTSRVQGASLATALSIAAHLLNMEATTPLLHAGYAFKRTRHDALAAATLVALIAAWVPLRLSGPWRAFWLIDDLALSAPHALLPLVRAIIGGLLALQVTWFVKLLTLAFRKGD